MRRRRTLLTPDVLALSHLAASTLNRWVKLGYVGPSLGPGEGKRYDRFWSLADAVTVMAVKALRDAGCDLDTASTARTVVARALRRRGDRHVVFWTGSDLVELTDWNELVSAVRHPGQLMFQLVALPVTEWYDRAWDISELRPVDKILVQREERRTRPRRTPTAALDPGRGSATGDAEEDPSADADAPGG